VSDPRDFYDGLAESFHLIFQDWDRSIARQGEALASILAPLAPENAFVIDAAAGIRTQSLALALRGFPVIGGDLSPRAVTRARREARLRQLSIPFVVSDFRALPFRSGSADVVMACDNALPHLQSIDEIKAALLEMKRCVRPGGVVLITMRDYSPQPPGTVEHHPYGEREWDGRRFIVEQEWFWQGATYQLTMRIRPLEEQREDAGLELRTTYFAVSIDDVLRVMAEAGLRNVTRVDGQFFQPVLLGTVGA
jgi:ubiquinone/menaquinone biosynthesis C-methylase UbiE